jgi:NAD(P)-dependent dehydrogenase (short-subunit alcohol dehydrogenase family)
LKELTLLKEFSLDGRFALITGGSKGLGYAMASALARAGADVAISSRHQDEIAAAAHKLAGETGRRIVPLVADVTCAEDVQRLTSQAIDAFGQIDILINNAGINIRKPVIDQTEEEFRRIIDGVGMAAIIH